MRSFNYHAAPVGCETDHAGPATRWVVIRETFIDGHARGQSQFYERDFAREQAEGLAALCNDEAQESGEHVVQHWEDTSESEAEFEARVAGLVNAPAIAA